MVPSRLLLAVVFVGFSAWATAAPVPKEKPREGFIGVVKDGEMLLLTSDGKTAHTLKPKKPWPSYAAAHPAPTATGFPVAVLAHTDNFEVVKGKRKLDSYGVWLIAGPDDPNGKRLDLGETKLHGRLHWSLDGRRLFLHAYSPIDEMVANQAKYGDYGVGKFLAVDPATGKATDLPLPEGHQLLGETADGQFLTNASWAVKITNAGKGRRQPLTEMPLAFVSADGKKVTEAKPLPERYCPVSLSPDGRTLLCECYHTLVVHTDTLETFDVLTGEGTVIEPADLKGKAISVGYPSWSLDGKRIAFGYSVREPGGKTTTEWKEDEWKVMVCDADGKNCKELASRAGAWALTVMWK